MIFIPEMVYQDWSPCVSQGACNNGDEVLVPMPDDYPLWTASISLAGGKPVHYICDEQNRLEQILKIFVPKSQVKQSHRDHQP